MALERCLGITLLATVVSSKHFLIETASGAEGGSNQNEGSDYLLGKADYDTKKYAIGGESSWATPWKDPDLSCTKFDRKPICKGMDGDDFCIKSMSYVEVRCKNKPAFQLTCDKIDKLCKGDPKADLNKLHNCPKGLSNMMTLLLERSLGVALLATVVLSKHYLIETESGAAESSNQNGGGSDYDGGGSDYALDSYDDKKYYLEVDNSFGGFGYENIDLTCDGINGQPICKPRHKGVSCVKSISYVRVICKDKTKFEITCEKLEQLCKGGKKPDLNKLHNCGKGSALGGAIKCLAPIPPEFLETE